MNRAFVVSKEAIVVTLIAGALAFVLLFGGSAIGIHRAFAQVSTSTSQTINLSVNQTITLTLSSGTLNLGAFTPGAAVYTTSSATVSTNSNTGWNLQVNRNNGVSTLSSSTITFPDATAWNGAGNASTAPGANLSFKVYQTGTTAGLYNSTNWGANDTFGTAKYAGFPTAATNVASTSTYSGSAQVVVLGVRADAPATQAATSYTGQITVTAITNP